VSFVYAANAQIDAWRTYHSRYDVLWSSVALMAVAGLCTLAVAPVRPGRPVASILIGLIATMYAVPPLTEFRPRLWEQLAANQLFRFDELTCGFMAFCIPVTIGFWLARPRVRQTVK